MWFLREEPRFFMKFVVLCFLCDLFVLFGNRRMCVRLFLRFFRDFCDSFATLFRSRYPPPKIVILSVACDFIIKLDYFQILL